MVMLAAFVCVPATAQSVGQRIKLNLKNGSEFIGTYVDRQDEAIRFTPLKGSIPIAVPYSYVTQAYASTDTRRYTRRGAVVGLFPVPLGMVIGLVAGLGSEGDAQIDDEALAAGGLIIGGFIGSHLIHSDIGAVILLGQS